MSTELSLKGLRLDGGTQSRAALDPATVARYVEVLREEGKTLPPITVFYDGTAYWLVDGFHRVAAFQEIGRTLIQAQIRQGTQRDAILYSVGANATHGLPRTNADKRRAVLVLLQDTEWPAQS